MQSYVSEESKTPSDINQMSSDTQVKAKHKVNFTLPDNPDEVKSLLAKEEKDGIPQNAESPGGSTIRKYN